MLTALGLLRSAMRFLCDDSTAFLFIVKTQIFRHCSRPIFQRSRLLVCFYRA